MKHKTVAGVERMKEVPLCCAKHPWSQRKPVVEARHGQRCNSQGHDPMESGRDARGSSLIGFKWTLQQDAEVPTH
jgi:hypothetical protein